MFNSFKSNSDFTERKKDLMERTPILTTLKYVFALSFIISTIVMVFNRNKACFDSVSGKVLLWTMCILVGFMYAHFTEIQHELLHGHGFRSNTINRVLGFVSGMFMISSYSHYRYSHLLHHRYLGTSKNTEFFSYPKAGLNGPFKLLFAAMNLSRYLNVGKLMWNGLRGIPVAAIADMKTSIEATQEYAAYARILILSSLYTLVSRDMTLVYAWFLPTLLISEATHYLLELPEHFGLNANGDPDAYNSTRTIDSNWFFWWFTNGNNLHTAHHILSRVPMSKTPELNEMLKNKFKVHEPSYLSFYSKVISGEVVPFDNGRETINA